MLVCVQVGLHAVLPESCVSSEYSIEERERARRSEDRYRMNAVLTRSQNAQDSVHVSGE